MELSLIKNGNQQNKNNMKQVKLFKGSYINTLEKEINEWLSKNNVDIINILQSSSTIMSDTYTTITIVYVPNTLQTL